MWVNIIYEEEKISLLNYIHYSNNHMKRESMDLKLLDMVYYWYGYSNDITKFIYECGICHTEKIKEKLTQIPKIILTKGLIKDIKQISGIYQMNQKKILNTNIVSILQII